jgi:hypothetical protein
MLPADQCLGTEQRTCLGVDLRLVMQQELALLDAVAQVAGEGEFSRIAAVLALVEEHVPGAVRLCGVHRDVGPLQQLVGGGSVLGAQCRADAAADGEVDVAERERFVEGVVDSGRDRGDVLLVGDAGQQDGELVTAEAGDDLVAAQEVLHAVGDLDE